MTAAPFVCPFCPLHCDDLDLSSLVQSQTQSVPERTCCPLLSRRFAAALEHDSIAQQPSPQALQTARGWIAEAQRILVTGHSVDLETSRALCRFAELTGAQVLPGEPGDPAAPQSAAYRETFSREGIFATTLGDAASAYSSVIMIGDPGSTWPRLHQRLAAVQEILAWQNTHQLAERLAGLRFALRRGSVPLATWDADLARSQELCERAQRIVFVIAPAVVAPVDAAAFWSTLAGLLRDLNPQRRAVLLRFDDQITYRSAHAWRHPASEHDTLGDRRVQTDLWIQLRPWPGNGAEDAQVGLPLAGKRIVIGCDDAPASSASAQTDAAVCHLAASTPGIGRDAVVLRGDGSVALPLRAVRSSALPSPAEVLRMLLG